MDQLFLSVFSRRRGFTLTELMAVVIIVAILAAVGAGSYKQAIERSRFSDGLVAANTVLGAVERYYDDSCGEGHCISRPKIKYLDISLANQKNCTANTDFCTKTKYFEITVYDGYVEAKRMKGTAQGDYSILVYPESFGENGRTDTQCHYNSDLGQDLCVSVGYATCSDSSKSCTK